MPVPKPVTMIIPNYLPHKQKNVRKVTEEAKSKLELVFKHATIDEVAEICEDSVKTFTSDIIDCGPDIIVAEAINEIRHLCEVKSVTIKTCEIVQKVQTPPPPTPEKKNAQSCKKHSRCHCDLLSLDTTEFFSIKV